MGPKEAKRRGCLAQGGRFQSSCAILERNLKDYVGFWKLERHGSGQTRADHDQIFVEDLKAAFS
jgi:hypothetical protein